LLADRRLPIASAPSLSRLGATLVASIYDPLATAREAAPEGELGAFDGLLVASQYRVPYGLTIQYVPRGSDVLDWGCGDGHFSRFLLGQGYSVTAYSLQHEPYILRTLPESLVANYRYVQGDRRSPTALPFPAGSFDAVFSIGVLEHVREEGGTEVGSLAELRRVLRSSGLFVCCHLPNKFSLSETATTALAPFRKSGQPRHHQYRFRATDVSQLCQDSGLHLLELGSYGLLPRNVMRFLPQMVKNSVALTRAVNRFDDGLAAILPWVCQNHFFVARPV
jgi:SAM-dependent methyltransferase